jgi:hypothetical protein
VGNSRDREARDVWTFAGHLCICRINTQRPTTVMDVSLEYRNSEYALLDGREYILLVV